MTEHHYRHFEALCAVVSTALLVVDENQQCTYLNPAAEKLTGYTLAQLQGRPLDCIAHRWPRSTFASGSANGANSPPNSPYQGQIAIVGKDGHHCDLNFLATPLWQDERFCGTAIELQTSANPQRTGDASQTLRTSEESALKQANKQLEQTVQERTTYLHHSEERYRTLFKSIDQGFCIIKVLFDEQGTPCDYVFLETNPAFARHAAQADLVGAHVRTLAPDHEQHWYDLYGRVARTGTSEHCVNQAGHRWFDVYAFQVKDQEPDTVGVLLSDVTERKQAEEELRRAYSLLEGITAGSEDLIAALDLDFNFLYFNTAYQREFRQLWQRELHAGDNLLAAMQHWPEEQNKARELWRRALSGETFSVTMEFGPSLEERRTYDLRFNPLYDAHGNITGGAHIFRDVTDQVEFARNVRESEERYRLIARATNDVIWDWNLETNQVDWNEAAISQFGYSLQEMGHAVSGWYDRIHPEDVGRVLHAIHAAIDGEQNSWKDEYRFRKKDGTYAVFLDRGYIARDSSGKPYRMIGSMLNRTERRRAEEALRRTAAADAFRVALTDAIRPHAEPIEIQTAVTRVLGLHLEASRVFYAEISEDGAEATIYTDYCHGQTSIAGRHQLDSFGIAIMDRMRAGETITVQDVSTDHRLSDAERHATTALDVHAYVVVPLIKSDRAVATLAVHQSRPREWSDAEIALIEETAERTWAAVERALTEEHLRASEQRFRLLTDGIPHMVWLSNAKGQFEFLSRQFSAYTGVPSGPVDGQDLTPLVIHPHDVTPTQQAWEQALRERRTYIVEHRVRSYAGDYRWFISRAEPQIDVDTGLVLRWYGTTTDIHDQKVAEETLRQADRQKDEFLAMLAHELRNPLAAVRNVGQLLNSLTEPDSQARHYVDILRRQTGTLSGLVEELLDVSRITRGLVELKREPVNLADVINHAVESVQGLLDEKRHEVDVALAQDNVVAVTGDQIRLEQIVVNLLTNAAKYTDPGGRISVHLTTDGDQAELRIADNGIGMTQEVIDRIFILFGQAERGLDRAQGGLGIGLTVSKNLVELHGGSIKAHSAGPGTGAEFVVRLPLAATENAAVAHPGRDSAPTASGKCVLLVEDSEDVAETLATLLENSGHRVTVAHNGKTALEKVESIEPDLVLLDIGLPEMDGYELARRLREKPHLQGTTIAALTGYGQPGDRARAEAAGFNAHFIKPVDWPTLQAFVNQSPVTP